MVFIHRRKKKRTLREYAEAHLATSYDLRESTRYRYSVDLSTHVYPTLGSHQLAKLTTDDMREWLRGLETDGVGPTAVSSARTALGRVMGAAVKEGILDRNPLAPLPWHKPKNREVRPLTPEQVRDIAEAIYPRWKAAVYVAAYGGLRIGELGGLKLSDLDLKNGRVTVARTVSPTGGVHINDPKTAAGKRTVTLPRFVVQELADHIIMYKVEDFVFTTASGGHLHSRAISREWKAALRKAGVDEDTRFHDLRHTAASLAIKSGASVKALQARMGHSNPNVTLSVYSHLYGGEDKAIADGLDALNA